jgi:hypothetical protein
MKKVLGLLAIGFSFALNAQAAVINLLPSSGNIDIGDVVSLNVNISGVHEAGALGVYDLNLNYDSNLFAVKSIAFGDSTKGNQLDVSGFGSLQSNNSGNGWLNIFELSFDAAEDLINFQANDFSLFSVVFTALDKGTGLFSVNVNSFGDAYGNNLQIDSINNASVNVPEPTGIALIGLGLLALGVSRINRKT